MTKTDPRIDAAWRAIHRADKCIQSILDTALNQARLPNTEVYSALCELHTNPQQKSAKDLENALLLPQYGVSRLLSRMERSGLISRTSGKSDHRKKILKLTKKGERQLAEMSRVYQAALAEHLGERMKLGQLERIARLLSLLDDDTD
ncbi:MAG: MarR family transcriptional regulator [Pseudomonadota bacterium]